MPGRVFSLRTLRALRDSPTGGKIYELALVVAVASIVAGALSIADSPGSAVNWLVGLLMLAVGSVTLVLTLRTVSKRYVHH